MDKRDLDAIGDLYLVEIPDDILRCLRVRLRQKKDFMTVEDVVVDVLRSHFAKEVRHRQELRSRSSRAPLDHYLPKGADPFEPVKIKVSGKLPIDFSEIHRRSKAARPSQLLK